MHEGTALSIHLTCTSFHLFWLPFLATMVKLAYGYVFVGVAVASVDPYCNVDMQTGVIPPFPAGSTLVQAQILIRHGSRTKCSTFQCWADDDTSYECNATLLDGPIAPQAEVLPAGSLVFSKGYLQGRNQLPGNCATGQLVEDGVKMQLANGKNLREAYSSILPVSPVGNESMFFLRSDDCPRTVASGQALFSAMFPDLPGAGIVVPWHVMDAAGEETITCHSTTVCPAFAAAKASADAAAKRTPHYANVSVPLAAELATALGRPVSPSQVLSLLDCVMSVNCPTVPSRGSGPPAAFTPELQQRTVAETVHSVYEGWNDTLVSRFGAGPLIGEIAVAMEVGAPRSHSPTRPLAHSPARPLARSRTRSLAHSLTRVIPPTIYIPSS